MRAWLTVARNIGVAVGLSGSLSAAAGPSVAVQEQARALLAGPLPDRLPGPDVPAGEEVWRQVLAHSEWSGAPVAARLVWRGEWGVAPLELDLEGHAERLAAVYLCLADDRRNRAREVELQLVPEPPRDCNLRAVLAPEVALERAGATRLPYDDAFLDRKLRYVDLASCCASPRTPRWPDCPDCEYRDQLLVDGRTGECLVYDQRQTSIDPGFDPTWDGTVEKEPPVPSFRCPSPSPEPLDPCDVDRLLRALVEVESALRARQPASALGEELEEATGCQLMVPRSIAARVLRAIGATCPPLERAEWWSAAREVEPSFDYGEGEVSPELRQAAMDLETVPWRHVSLARRVVDGAEAQRDILAKRYARRRNAYSWLPLPRGWALAGVSSGRPAHGVGASIGAGSTFVAFAERSGGTTFVGAGTHSFIGDTYNHSSDEMDRMMCRVLHRHYVRPGLLVGGVRDTSTWGLRVRPEVSSGLSRTCSSPCR